ncbi:MAG: replicative DNA helicase [Bacilli bacterium]|nr:replicative DNA helicase [Bacilli bacterium]
MASYENLYNYTAERYVLGSILIDSNVMNGVSGTLGVNDFYNEDNRKVYEAMTSLFKNQSPIEVLLVVDELKRLNLNLSEDPKTFLLNLTDEVPTTATTELYVNLVKDKSIERELHRTFNEINSDILTGKLEFNQLLDKTEDSVLKIIKYRRTSDLLTIETAAQRVYEQIASYNNSDGYVKGVATGFPALDKSTLGFQKGDLIILAARPSIGKSAFALNLAVNACRNRDCSVAFFSLEMSIEQLMMRLFSYESSIPMSSLQKGNLTDQEMILLGRSRQKLSEYNIYFDESNSTNVYDIRTKCRQLKQQGHLDMVIIDYLQLITSEGKGSRQEEVAAISRSLKVLAKELDVPVIALSQLSRNVETREDKTPVLSDLRESGSIEQDADIVMFLHRPEDSKKSEGGDEEVVEAASVGLDTSEKLIELVIAKNRQGALNNIKYNFYPAECRFREVKHITVRKQKHMSTEEE